MRLFSDTTFRRAAPARAAIGLMLLAWLQAAGCKSPTQPPPPPPPPDELRLSCPPERLLEATSPEGTDVHFESPAPAGGLAPVTVECTPGSGGIFPVGETSVQCTATAANMVQAACGFAVRVRVSQTLARTKFLAFGDSITAGVVDLPSMLMLGPPDTYPFKLEQMLLQRYPAQTFMVPNYGDPGEKSIEGAVRLPNVLETEKPEVLLLLEGINAINPLTVSSQANALEDMIDAARRRNVEVIIATVMPITPASGEYKGGTMQKIRDLNTRIFDLAAEYRIGPPVDLFSIFEANIELISKDGIHPTIEGQTRIAEAFRDEIVRRYDQQMQSLTTRRSLSTPHLRAYTR